MPHMLGIDTSHWKKDINLANVSLDFIYTKATEGNYYIDDSCDPIIQQAIAHSKKWGVFHFATNRKTDAITEANYFVDNCLGYIGRGLLILDNESYRWSDGSLANDPGNVAWCKEWLDHVQTRTGVKPLIYMSSSVVDSYDWSSVIEADYGLIVAAYPKRNQPIYNYDMSGISDPNPSWGAVGNIAWQFTSTGHLDGYGGVLDCNIFYGNEATWDAYAKVNSPSVPDPVTTQPVSSPEPSTPATPAPTPKPIPEPPSDTETAPTPLPVSQNDNTVTVAFFKSIWQYVIELFKRLKGNK